MTQYSLFGAEAAAPDLADLDGLLLAGGQWVRSGPQARLSVVVSECWRADALANAFAERGLECAEPVVDAAAGFGVRTSFATELAARATRWTRGSRQAVPNGFTLGAGGLRLWAIAAGHRDDVGYLLGTVDANDPLHLVAGSQLARIGVAAAGLPHRGGPGWRVTSTRRLRRLTELVGPPPSGAGTDWPTFVDPAGH